MYLHEIILYHLIFIIIYCHFSMGVPNEDLEIIETGLGDISPCYVGLQFFATLNNTGDEDLFVEMISDECCINSDGDLDYDSIQVMGQTSEVIEKGKVKTFTLVAPVLDPYERTGYCMIHVDSRPVDKRSNIMRDTINIEFDTSLGQNNDISSNEVKKCENIDEDPLNDCKPVDCDTYYNGKRPIFDETTKICIEAPKCRSKKSEDSIYDPKENKCTVVDQIKNEDLEFIRSLNQDRSPKDVIIVESPDSVMLNSSLYKYFFDLNNTLKTEAMIKNKIKSEIKRKYIYSSIMEYLKTNKYTLLVLGIVIFVQCCLICTMIYCLTKRSICNDRKKVEKKYFNYRQDVSVTTPLIATSNIDTETVFDYVSDSSNIEKKIKCYKSCQKERENDPKISMSDDILTKCLNRRNWNTKPKSDTAKDANNSVLNSFNPEWKVVQSNMKETNINNSPKQMEEKETKREKEMVEEKHRFRTRVVKEDYADGDSSEKFIKCHNYNVQTNQTGPEIGKKAASMSTEKGAQACFSNDSIDDFLSERGMVFLAGERLSKYSLSTNTASTDRSSRTSKNRHIVKNVLSYLSRKSKKYTSSDPGVKKENGKDLELIHMSRASMYSSSASSEYKNIQGIRLAKDSRTSF